MKQCVSVLDYVIKIRNIVEDLKVVVHIISDGNYIIVCLERLPRNYGIFKTSLHVFGIFIVCLTI